jgi:hypothetical protein
VIMRRLAPFLLLAACSGKDAADDGNLGGACWPLENTHAGGSVEAGTGELAFMPMPNMLGVVANGSQSDPYLVINVKMKGIDPGDPQDALNPDNPHTKITGTVDALSMTFGVDCPARIGYMPSASQPGYLELAHGLRIGLKDKATADAVGGDMMRISVAVVDKNGTMATDEKTVIIEALDNGSGSGGGTDAGIDAP